MEQSKISRINQLSRKAKAEGLTAEERKEQFDLRHEYLEDMKKSLRSTLDQVVFVDEHKKN